jgi:hypothetical protein
MKIFVVQIAQFPPISESYWLACAEGRKNNSIFGQKKPVLKEESKKTSGLEP